MGWSTSIVAPPDGSMRLYLDLLEKLRAFDHAVYWPGHGGPVAQPQRFLRALLHHRRAREKSIPAVLETGPLAVTHIVEKVYEKLDFAPEGGLLRCRPSPIWRIFARAALSGPKARRS